MKHPPEQGDDTRDSRTSVLLPKDLLKVVRALAYWHRKKIKDVFEEAIQAHVEKEDPTVIWQALALYSEKEN